MNTAIIVAAGSGTRFGGDTPKQFLKISNKILLDYTIEKFIQCQSIDSIVLVLASDQHARFRESTAIDQPTKTVQIVGGGDSRNESVAKGFACIEKHSAETVAVHDGARPLIEPEEISKTIEAAEKTGAACLVGAVTDTIKQVRAGKIIRTVDRANLRRALTPQCFRYRVLEEALEAAENSAEVTDECSLVERLGIEISIVEGSSKNIKVTNREDLDFVRQVLRQSNI